LRDQIDVLLDKIEDPALRKELAAEVERLRAKRSFGLVFEAHLPERVRLPEHAVRVGGTVVYRDDPDSATYEVVAIDDDTVAMRMVREPDGSSLALDDERRAETVEVTRHRVVVIADFGAPIHPGLRHLGSVDRGSDKPSHVVIKGENHHVLEALQFTHAGKIDCIYIDPPYNTGARDWKYDNDYVDDTDAYRHSKWLAFMERRLLLAKRLLNPDDSVLIVTIDENELARLTLLIEQTFPGCKRQAITTVISPGGTSRTAEFSRVEEYLLVVYFGSAEVSRTYDSMLGETPRLQSVSDLWEGMVRRGNGVVRAQRPGQFYPVYVDPAQARIVGAGEPLPKDAARTSLPDRAGLVTVWPMKPGGIEGFWQLGQRSLLEAVEAGTAKAVRTAHGSWTVKYMKEANAAAVREGRIATVGYESNGDRCLAIPDEFQKAVTPKTVWFRPAHDPSVHGARLVMALIENRDFPFPKSLYAVEDTIRFFVKDKANAVVLDFFGGSGTTTHAVARLNRQDGGRRQSILVTNNEVSADEAKAMRERGLYPGDPEWEALGIFEHVTRPRIEAAITGLTPGGEPVKGDYKFTDEFPMAEGFEENVEFCELTYLDHDDVELDLAFEALAPLLWLRAGARGPVLAERTGAFEWTERYGVLFDPDRWRAFVAERPDTATTAFVVTDSSSTFAGIAAELPDSMDVVRLYENYLTTFAVAGAS
jgi:adenine-specific DNA-methyltransferase